MNLQGKNVIITGISKGIGKALALALLEKGAHVAGIGKTKPDYSHPHLRFIECDVRNYAGLEKAFDEVLSGWNNSLHVLINNAGLGYFGKLENISLDQYQEMMDVNVNGVFYACKLALPVMKKAQYGHIITISSTAGLEAYPEVGVYCATKFAVKAMMGSLYQEVRYDQIKVTCLYPGSVKTDFFRNSPGIQPHDFMLMPEDIATAMVQVLETPDNYHVVNYEVRPLRPKGDKK
ncbi:MAG: SDR family NAD(P)-dependent oxidoreductase [Bacteroidota bacterium]|nr:SDR family NAD(P)-dependent oxidoreductase [Bacteroidota bacterium]MDX5431131.1 SDR family NAD(P)-dependent oxidoreductase [Bacteroidota bacterium]MDX5469878.1 SDR family NAD(P)-dependent oxidoreductase [Bacteroidota bacterium]